MTTIDGRLESVLLSGPEGAMSLLSVLGAAAVVTLTAILTHGARALGCGGKTPSNR